MLKGVNYSNIYKLNTTAIRKVDFLMLKKHGNYTENFDCAEYKLVS